MRPSIVCAAFLTAILSDVAGVGAGSDPTRPSGKEGAGVFGQAAAHPQPNPITGVMESSVAFELPRARGAAQPQLALSYNSSTLEREAGYGWGLVVHSIERKPLSGWPRYIDDGDPQHEDRYVFDGQPLAFICVVGAPGCEQVSAPMPLWATGWRAYRLQVEGLFARFFLDPRRTTWRVQRKGGELLELGVPLTHAALASSPATEIGDAGKVFRWRLARQVDVDGNVVVYRWEALGVRGLLYLTDIYDTPPAAGITTLATFAHHTELSWERPGFPIRRYAKIDKAQPDMRLTRVGVASMPWSGAGPREVVRLYHLRYYATRGVISYVYERDAPLWHHSFLKEVQLEGKCSIVEAGERILPSTKCERMPATRFAYQTGALDAKGGLFHAETHDTPPGEDEANFKVLPNVESVAIIDLNRDGLPDVVQSWPSNEVIDVTNDGPFVRKRPGYLNIGDKGLLQIQLRHQCLDMGSGNPGDLAFYNLGQQAGFLTPGGGATVLGAWGDSPLLWSKTDYAQMTASPVEAHPAFCDMFSADPQHGAWAWVKGDEVGWSKHQQGAPSPLARNHWFADVDGDGLPDSFNRTASAGGDLELANVDFSRRMSAAERGGRASGAALIPFVTNFALGGNSLTPAEKPRDGSHFFYVDINGDGLLDLVTFNVDSSGGPNEFVPVVRPGDGRGVFGCETNREPAAVNCAAPPAGSPPWLTPAYFIHAPGTTRPMPFTDDTYIHDVTGDGLADIIQYEPSSSFIRLWINQDGETFLCAKPGGSTPCVVNRFLDGLHGTLTIDPHRVTFADMDANGIDDMVLIGKSGVWASSVYSTPAVTPRAPRPGLLVSIDNGLGATTLIDYRTIQELDLAAIASNEPWEFHSPQVVAVVSQIRTVDAKTASGIGSAPDPYKIDRRTVYEYEDPAYDPWSRSFLGFRKVRVKEGFDLAVTETTYWFGPCQRGVKQCPESSDDERWKALTGRPVRVDRLVPEALRWRAKKLLSTTLYEYVNDTLFQQTPDQTVHHAYARAIDTYLYDTEAPVAPGRTFVFVGNGDLLTAPATQPGRAHIREIIEMDENGNVVKRISEGRAREDGSANPGVDGRIVRVADVQCNRSWQCLTATETISADPANGPPRKTRYSYDALGRATLAEIDLVGVQPLDRHHEVAGSTIAPPPPTAAAPGWTKVLAFDYDAFGNAIRIEGAGSVASCVTVTYDAAYAQLPETTTSHTAGCTSTSSLTSTRVFDRGFGLIVAERSPTEGLTEIRLDAFGRPQVVNLPRPDAPPFTTSPSLTFRYHDGSPLSWVAVARQTGSGTLNTIEVSNGLGESVFGFDRADPTAGDPDPWVLRGWIERNAAGRVTRTYRPSFFSADPSSIATAATPVTPPAAGRIDYTYDSFGREIFVTDGNVVTAKYRYAPLSVEAYDAEQAKPTGARAGQHTTTRLDGHGRVASTITVVKGDEIRVDTQFLATGEPWRIMQSHAASAERVTRTLAYDSMGRVVLNVEPNTSLANGASWRYAWDAAGHMVGTSDARGCGENIFYDGLGRVVAEDYSPCLESHAAYTPPNLTTGDGTEAFYRYDDYEPGQVQPDPGFADSGRLAVSRLVSLQDRGAHTRFNYDNRGRLRRLGRRVVTPGPPAADLGKRYASHWFQSRLDYDAADRLVRQTTGADVPELLVGGTSQTSFVYSARGYLRQIDSTYGMLLSGLRVDADGSPRDFIYGDAAATATHFSYDPRRRLSLYTVSRSAPALWGTATPTYVPPGPETRQLQLQALSFTHDDAGNVLAVADASPAGAWPTGMQPTSRTFQYDDRYRTTRIDYATGMDKQVSPFAPEEANADRRPVPVRGGPRLGFQTFAYDWKGNTIASDDDRQVRYDRSLGAILNGELAGQPNQLVSASGIKARYDAAGNLADLTVERTGCPGSTPSSCTHRFVYEWDEIGQLTRAMRWDYPGGTIPATEPTFPARPATPPVWALHYAYSNGERVLKTVTNARGDQRHTLDVFETLRVDRANFAGGDYERKPEITQAYLGGLGRLVYDTRLPSPAADPRHVYLLIGDQLGSTSAVIDRQTGELVERATYQAFGAIESDYRPERWSAFREDVKFTGKEADIEVGATYFGARYYNPQLGRFMSADPQTIHALKSDPNPYAYVSGRVTTRVDPLGLEPCGQDMPCEVTVKGPPRGSAERAAELASARAEVLAESAMQARKVTPANLALGTSHIPIPGTRKAYFTPMGVRKVAVNAAIDLLDPLKYGALVKLFTGNPLAFHVGEDSEDKSAIVGAVTVTLAMAVGGRAAGAPPVSAEEAGLRTLAEQVSQAGGFWARLSQTVSVLRTAEGPLLVGGGVRDLTPAQRAFANTIGLVPVRLAGVHAEGTVLTGAAKASLTPLFGATTRGICWVCERDIVEGALTAAGGQLTPSGLGFFFPR